MRMMAQGQRDRSWRREQRDKKIQQRKQDIAHAEGHHGHGHILWWIPHSEHEGTLSKSTVYMGPHDAEDKTSGRNAREFRQNKTLTNRRMKRWGNLKQFRSQVGKPIYPIS